MSGSTQDGSSASQSDLSSDSIRGQGFGTVRRGLDPAQVSGYLNRVADRVGTLETRIAELESELVAVSAETADTGSPDGYATISAQLAGVMKAFDQDVERLRADAAAEADRTISDAKAESERIRVEAEHKAKEVVAGARGSLEAFRRDAEAEIAQLTLRRGSIASELRDIRQRLLIAIDQLPQPDDQETPAPPGDPERLLEIVDETVGDRDP
jgi:DivIVA domain-containing protein